MSIFLDIYNFFSLLSFIDIIFLVAIIVLIILIVTLIYFVKINDEVFTENDFFDSFKTDTNPIENDKMVNNIVEVDKKKEEIQEEYNDEEAELLDLETLTKKLKEESNERINFTAYEKDQEEKAIISYDELIKNKNKYAINYEKEEMIDDISVKKVDLNDLVNKSNVEYMQEEVRVISYQKEEAFLNALKELNSLLN